MPNVTTARTIVVRRADRNNEETNVTLQYLFDQGKQQFLLNVRFVPIRASGVGKFDLNEESIGRVTQVLDE